MIKVKAENEILSFLSFVASKITSLSLNTFPLESYPPNKTLIFAQNCISLKYGLFFRQEKKNSFSRNIILSLE